MQAAYTLLNFPRESIENKTRILGILGAGGRQSFMSRVSRHRIDLTDLFVAQECLGLLRRISIKKLETEEISESLKKIHEWVGLTAKEVIKRKMKNVVSTWQRPEDENESILPRTSKWRQARTSTLLSMPKKRFSEPGMPQNWPQSLGVPKSILKKSKVENVEVTVATYL